MKWGRMGESWKPLAERPFLLVVSLLPENVAIPLPQFQNPGYATGHDQWVTLSDPLSPLQTDRTRSHIAASCCHDAYPDYPYSHRILPRLLLVGPVT